MMKPVRQFDDQFSKQSDSYARYRPRYPDGIFEDLAGLAPERQKAWDCATGNGQAACGLARFFDEVIATDASEQQIANRTPCENVVYSIAVAENSGLPDKAFDLVTVANAAHWFDRPAFYAEARRVLKPGGVLALWRNEFFRTMDPAIDQILYRLGEEILKDYWSPKIHAVRNGYTDQPFPFEGLPPPEYDLRVEWTLEELRGYFDSWSATHAYIKERAQDPVDLVYEDLRAVWGPVHKKRVLVAPLQFMVGRV